MAACLLLCPSQPSTAKQTTHNITENHRCTSCVLFPSSLSLFLSLLLSLSLFLSLSLLSLPQWVPRNMKKGDIWAGFSSKEIGLEQRSDFMLVEGGSKSFSLSLRLSFLRVPPSKKYSQNSNIFRWGFSFSCNFSKTQIIFVKVWDRHNTSPPSKKCFGGISRSNSH